MEQCLKLPDCQIIEKVIFEDSQLYVEGKQKTESTVIFDTVKKVLPS
jgi:hypothetical protein